MKKEELRIGSYYRSVKFGVPVRCTLADLYDLCAQSDGAYDDPPIEDMFEPIPLTKRWLSDMQFKSCPKNKNFPHIEMPYYAHNAVLLFYNEERTRFESTLYLAGYGSMRDGGYYVTTFRWIWGVHELQNLYFALTGKELIV